MAETHHLTRRGTKKSLFIRPIGIDVRPDELKLEFAKFGTVRDVHIPVCFKTRSPRGFAYVEYVFKYKYYLGHFYLKTLWIVFLDF